MRSCWNGNCSCSNYNNSEVFFFKSCKTFSGRWQVISIHENDLILNDRDFCVYHFWMNVWSFFFTTTKDIFRGFISRSIAYYCKGSSNHHENGGDRFFKVNRSLHTKFDWAFQLVNSDRDSSSASFEQWFCIVYA